MRKLGKITAEDISTKKIIRKHLFSDVLLVGQPNVGKSVLFSRMTGVRTIASNYPGTTVSYAAGRMRFSNVNYHVVDAPGTYSLEPLDDASRVAVDLIDDAGRFINVVDVTHLERHLPLSLELIEQKKPMVVALNMSDEARHKGIKIDVDKLTEKLGVPVIPIVARTGEGIRKLILSLLALPLLQQRKKNESGHPGHHPHIQHYHPQTPITGHTHLVRNVIWQRVGDIVEEVQTLVHHHHSFGERLEDISVHPVWGGLFALSVLALSFSLIRLIGEFL